MNTNPNLLSIEEICGLMSDDTWRCLVTKQNLPPSAFWDEIAAQKMIRDFLRTTLLNKVIYGVESFIPNSNVLVAFLMDRDIALVFNPLSGESVYWFKDGFLDGDIKAPSLPDLSGAELWDMMPRHPNYRDEGCKSALDSDSEFELEFDDLLDDTSAGFGTKPPSDDDSSVWDLNLLPTPPKMVDEDSEFELVLHVDDNDNVEPRLKSATEGDGVHREAEAFIDSMGQIHRPGQTPDEVDVVLELERNPPKGGPTEEQNEIEIKDGDDDIRVVDDEPKN